MSFPICCSIEKGELDETSCRVQGLQTFTTAYMPIGSPPLLDDRPEDLHSLVRHFTRRLVGDEPTSLADQATQWIETNLGPNYPWRGNIRELEQCISSIMIRNEYLPSGAVDSSQSGSAAQWTAATSSSRTLNIRFS